MTHDNSEQQGCESFNEVGTLGAGGMHVTSAFDLSIVQTFAHFSKLSVRNLLTVLFAPLAMTKLSSPTNKPGVRIRSHCIQLPREGHSKMANLLEVIPCPAFFLIAD